MRFKAMQGDVGKQTAHVSDVKAGVADGPGATAREDWPPAQTLGEWFYMRYFYDAAREPTSLWLVPEATHIDGLSKRPEAYEEKVVQFFDAALLDSDP
jgi:hypothetical protein